MTDPDPARISAGGRLPAVAYLLLAAVAVALFLPGFFDLPPFDRDEARFAQASFQMQESGDLVDIRFQEEARHKKPIGIYWLQAAATELLGGTEPKRIWTYRVPSLLGAVAAVLATGWAGARLFGPATGFIAGLLMASCVVLGVEARMAKTDAVLLATIVAGQGALAALYLGRRGPAPGWAPPLVFWIAAGLGILVKGPIVLLVSGTTALGLALWDREWAWLKRLKPLAGLAIVAAIAAPWLIAITVKTGGSFFAESVGHDMMGKVAGGQEGKGLPPGYYLGTFWVTFAPWSFLAPLAAAWAWANRRTDAVRFCIVWILPSWIVFEAVPTKLLHYTLPVFPAIAILAGAMLAGWMAPRPAGFAEGRGGRPLFAVAAGLGTLGFVALAVAIALLPWLVDGFIHPLAVAMVPVASVLFLLAVRLVAERRVRNGLAAGLAAVGVLYAVAYGAVLPSVDGIWISRQAARTVARVAPCPGRVVASAGYSEPSLVFLLGTGTRLVDGAEAARHLAEGGACALALVESRQEAAFRGALAGTEPVRHGVAEGINYNNGRRITLTLYSLASGTRP